MSGRWKTAFEHLLSAHTSAVNPTKAFSKPQGRSVNLRHEPFFIILLASGLMRLSGIWLFGNGRRA